MKAPNGRAAVKIRWQRGGLIGPWMSVDEALQAAERVQRAVVDCGDGPGFIAFDGFDGREARIRGREVVTVECVPDLPARVHASSLPSIAGEVTVRTPGGGAVRMTYPEHGVAPTPAPAAAGTEFLRQQTARQQVNGGRR